MQGSGLTSSAEAEMSPAGHLQPSFSPFLLVSEIRLPSTQVAAPNTFTSQGVWL
jgi:hypothetical protein